MKKSSLFLKFTILLFISIAVLPGCTKQDKEIKLGRYLADENFTFLILEEDKNFILNRHIVTSYDPIGSYTIEGDKLLLHVNDELEKDTIVFKIIGDKLVFESGELAESLIRKGTEFIYSDEE